jgi:predicted DNA-binding protein YlxM (UPF0122 family)
MFIKVLDEAYCKGCIARLEAYSQDLLGAAELAEVLSVSKQTISNRLARGNLIPEPTTRLALGPVWTKQAVLDWLTKT